MLTTKKLIPKGWKRIVEIEDMCPAQKELHSLMMEWEIRADYQDGPQWNVARLLNDVVFAMPALYLD